MSLSKKIEGTEYIGTWSDRKTPVYDILDIYGLNKIVGYVKHRYASEGTVLFRGQCRIYKHLVPSIKHEADKQEKNYLKVQGDGSYAHCIFIVFSQILTYNSVWQVDVMIGREVCFAAETKTGTAIQKARGIVANMDWLI